jgi:hypothetical protein
LRETQLILLDAVVSEPDPLPVIIVISVNHDLPRGMMLSHALVSLQ